MKRTILILLIIPLLFFITACNKDSNSTANVEETGPAVIESQYPGNDYQGNYLYAGAMTLAWQEFNGNILKGEKIVLDTTNQTALDLADKFNNSPFSKNDLDEASYYVNSGYGQYIIDKINEEVKAKFPQRSFEDIEVEDILGTSLISYAYFIKEVEYELQFTEKETEFLGAKVKGFYATYPPELEIVKILKYWDDDKFVIKIQLKDESDELILAKGFDMDQPEKVTEEINKYNKDDLDYLGEHDVFEMPELHLDYNYDYPELFGISIANEAFNGYAFEKVIENIKFDMDYKGARVEAEGYMQLSLGGMDKKPMKFVLDEPFWVIMKRQESESPYFILGVNNTGIMETI